MVKLSDMEEKLIKDGCLDTQSYLLRAARAKGYYKSKNGYRCYPIKFYGGYDDKGSSFVCVKEGKSDDSVIYKIINFYANKLIDCSLKICPELLPAEVPECNLEEAEWLHAENMDENITILKKDGRVFLSERISSHFGGGYSDGEDEAVAKILMGYGIDATDFNLSRIRKIRYKQLIDTTGHILGSNNVIISVDCVNNPNNDGYHLRMEHVSLSKTDPDYNNKFGLNKKSPLYGQLFKMGLGTPVVCHKIFMTKTGVQIYEIDHFLNKWREAFIIRA